MFAVPGWSLSASDLKRQTEIPQSSKKRKRKGQADKNAASNITSGDVEMLWKSQFKKESSKKIQRTPNGHLESSSKHNEEKSKKEQQKDNPATQRKSQVPSNEHGRKKNQKEYNEHNSTDASQETAAPPPKPPRRLQQSLPPPAPTGAKLTPMQTAMRAKLISARFRHLNETLYTTSSSNASNLFSENPAFFNEYHEGFRQQVENWPENPIDCFLKELAQRSNTNSRHEKNSDKKHKHKDKKQRSEQTQGSEISAAQTPSALQQPLPRTHGTCTIADLGAGDASLAQRLISNSLTTEYQLKIQSYDLATPNSLVTKADISSLPLPDGSINLAVFCLALMGTNWPDFIDEAWRVLHWKGELWVAEIKSRFGREPSQKSRVVEHSISNRQRKKRGLDAVEQQREQSAQNELLRKHVDGVEDTSSESTDVSAFVEVLKKRGFAIEGEPDLSNKMFVRMRFVKVLRPVKGKNVGKDLQQGKKPKTKFLDEEEGDERDDSEVLKPCLYKLR